MRAAVASAVAVSAITRLFSWIQRWRLQRSAMTPPSGEPIRAGDHAATVKRPSHSGLCVVSVRYTPRATVCIQVPVEDTNDETSERAKLRCRIGANDAEAIGTTLTPDPSRPRRRYCSVVVASFFFDRGRSANHHTDTMVASAPSTPMPDFTARPLGFSAMDPS